MNEPVHGTKAGYSKLAMQLAERVEADLVPKAYHQENNTEEARRLP
jgi:hypothetical protein